LTENILGDAEFIKKLVSNPVFVESVKKAIFG